MFFRLKNGATVLDQKKDVVIAHQPSSPNHPYVTWVVNSEGDTFWGNYFDNLPDAVRDFDKRTNFIPVEARDNAEPDVAKCM
jgi:hypothetical protein